MILNVSSELHVQMCRNAIILHISICDIAKNCIFCCAIRFFYIPLQQILILLYMETLFATSRELINRVSTAFVRDKHDEIDWNSRLVAILGSRGTGKTTMILQHIRLYDNTPQTLYVMADDFYFTTHRLVDLARQFMLQGGKHLYIDEIHKYPGWSTEIKNIYDMMPDLKVVYSGSSILDLEKGGADLSRRKLEYTLPGLSFREYLNISQGWNLPRYTLEEILAGLVDFPYAEARPLQLFNQYLREGYFPFFQEDNYAMRLNGIIKQVVEDDGLLFEKNVTSDLQKKCFNTMKTIFKSVVFKDKSIISIFFKCILKYRILYEK